ncbi:MAG: sodium:calcium antiporter, partial [Robiginitomaculum sp.]
AAWRGHTEVAIGNVLGSNVFNIFAVLGGAALVGPINIPHDLLVFDIWVMLAAIVALFALIVSRHPIGRKTGLVLMGGYLLYMGAIARSVMNAGGL